MKTLTLCVLSALALAAGGTAFAADANKNVVGVDYTDTVAPAQLQAYAAGVKVWNKCLHDDGPKCKQAEAARIRATAGRPDFPWG